MRQDSRGFLFVLFILAGLSIPVDAFAFVCGNTGTVYVDVSPTVFRNKIDTFATKPGAALINYGAGGISTAQSGVPAAPAGSGYYCALSYSYGDRVAVTAISEIHQAITSVDYTSSINIASTGISGSSSANYTFNTVSAGSGACLLCGSTSNTNWYRVNTPKITVTLTRTASWVAKPLLNGDTLLKLTVRRTDQSSSIGTIVFRMSGDVAYPTCEIKNFDKNVTLPEVKRTDLVSYGTGRYPGVTKEFNINLECENSPKVNVTFDGDKMPGVASEDVLVNKLTGNDNVGVQILYGSNPLKIGEKVTVLNAAGTNESLKFNA